MSTRREFLKVTLLSTGALAIGFRIAADEAAPVAPFRPNHWITIGTDGTVTLVVGKSEMGQGVRTSLPMILADELEVDLAKVRLEQAKPGPEFRNLGTGGSTSIETMWSPLRNAAAMAREMLVAAAAARWGVEPGACRATKSTVRHAASGRSLGYGELAAAAAKQTVPDKPRLKGVDERSIIGKRAKRIDGPDIVRGAGVFGLDVHVPGMLYATVIRPPVKGATIVSFDATKARGMAGVRVVTETARGIAVVAESTFAAMKARELVDAKWSDSPDKSFDSAGHWKVLEDAVATRGVTTIKTGSGLEAFGAAKRKLEAVYHYPFEAHAPIEPMNCTASVRDGRCELWAPTQSPNRVQQRVAEALKIPNDAVTVNVTLMGGGFGRRLNFDYAVEAALISEAAGAPVQVIWTREDDTKYGHLQSASVHRLFAGIDDTGRLIAWGHRKATTLHNINGDPTPEQKRDPEFLRGISWGICDFPYAIPSIETFHVPVDGPVRIGPWRAVFAPSSVFARESFLDEVAHELGKDPLSFRLELLGEGAPVGAIANTVQMGDYMLDRERLRAVVKLVADKSVWGKPAAAGKARGFACNIFEGGTMIAYVVDVSRNDGVQKGGLPFRVERVVAAIDCGVAVNPAGIEQQVESGVLWSLSNMKTEITFKAGAVEQTGYSDFNVVRIDETPRIETHIIPSHGDAPSGMGEPTVPPFAPAVVNALFKLTGKRYRRLPIREL